MSLFIFVQGVIRPRVTEYDTGLGLPGFGNGILPSDGCVGAMVEPIRVHSFRYMSAEIGK
jgi:hypothetical protein